MTSANEKQRDYWTNQAGLSWVDHATAMDHMLAPVLDQLLKTAALKAGERVLDIGCGSGASTVAISRAVGISGQALGVDISASLLAAARNQARGIDNIAFVESDAQQASFEGTPYDVALSRFGVMFFDDTTAAFANIRRALAPDGRVVFATWAPMSENPSFDIAAKVAERVLGSVPMPDPDAPGPFALKDAGRINSALSNAGFQDISVESQTVNLTPPGNAQQVAELFCEIGPAHRALGFHQADATAREQLISALTKELRPYEAAAGLSIPGVINMATARNRA